MKLKLNQIKYKLLLSFLFISVNLIVLAGLSLIYFQKAELLRQSENDVLRVNLLVNKLIINDNIFFGHETSNAEYFKNGYSPYLDHHRFLVKKLLNDIESIKQYELGQDAEATHALGQVKRNILEYDVKFGQILRSIHLRGFKDAGLEGEMRRYGHKLENKKLIPLESLLMLRRHEKDFFIRKEMTYVDKFNMLCKQLESTYFPNSGFSTEAGRAFYSYKKLFNQIVEMDLRLGLFNNSGMKGEIDENIHQIEASIDAIRIISHEYSESKIRQGRIFFTITVTLSILLSLVMGVFLARNLSLPITKLAKDMDAFNLEKQLGIPVVMRKDSTEEIRVLQESFVQMATTLQIQYADIKVKSDLLEYKNRSLNKLNKELDKFIYSASHDLKAPLSSLLGLVNLMKYEGEEKVKLEYLNLMDKNIRKLEIHIKEIINYAKNHQMEITWQKVDLKLMIEGIVEMLRYQEGAGDISVDIDIKESESFISDQMRLNMILFNLVSNSYKYHDFLKPLKTIKIRAEIGSSVSIISVEDNGIGIGNEHLDKIFHLFYRASEKSNGSGLGLFIVKEAVDKLGGQISVESKLHEGTKFTIQLPNIGQASYLGLTSFYSKGKSKGQLVA
ncbi:MAG: HAMP domain-containing histidine kinase [Cytophagales bacterium]|nr:HAMP domain-containing histidine kinase [Cytophagales bacterium]